MKDCPNLSGAQVALQAARVFLDQKNFKDAAEEYRKAQYYQLHDRSSEKLNTEEIGTLFGIFGRLKRFWQEEKIRPTPVEPVAPVLHGQHSTFQQHPAQFPDLMSFDEDVIQDQDFTPGV